MKILDELESLTGDSLYDVDQDVVGSFGYLTERGELVEKTLPALIRVARAAELPEARRDPNNRLQFIVPAEQMLLLGEALEQLRALGNK